MKRLATSVIKKAKAVAKPSQTPRKTASDVPSTVKSLKKNYPDAHCALHHSNAYELLLATILSAQCTDDRVNMVTPYLFAKYPTPELLAKAALEDVEQVIKSINFFRNKAKNIIACAQALVHRHQGQIPQTMEDLVQLAGVGRKTANVVLGNAFNISSGVVVDTHVARLSQRLGWTKKKTPEDIEKELMKIIPQQDWVLIAHLLISHGRAICNARRPLCETCFLFDRCPRIGV